MENGVSIEWRTLPETRCLRFEFHGYLTGDDAFDAIEQWRHAFLDYPHERITLVWDCLHMDGYERNARTAWTHALLEMKSQIGSIWLVTHSSIIKMGASVMALFSEINIHIVKSEADVLDAHTPPPVHFFQDKEKENDTTIY